MDETRSSKANELAVRHYWQQLRRDWYLALPSFLLPGIGSIFVFYVPPLVIAQVLAKFSDKNQLSFHDFLPYIFLFAFVWSIGEILWRIGGQFLAKTEIRGMERLYNQALDFLLERDITFFHNNFAGSITKKALGYARRYEEFLDVLSFNVFPSLLPLVFVVFILWRFSPWLVVALIGLLTLTALAILPLIHRRAKLVVARETASNVTAGYLADVVANADMVKAFGRETYELESYSQRVSDFMRKTKKTWDYHNLRINVVGSPLFVLVNSLGLAIAVYVGRNNPANLKVVFITFSYYVTTTRVIWEFNEIYRRIETVFSDAAQFTEYMINPPKIRNVKSAGRPKIDKGKVELRDVYFQYGKGDQYLFKNLNLKIKPGEKIALVGHSGGGKTTITRLLLRFMDIESGQILIDGQNISKLKQSELRHAIAYVPQEPTMFHRSLTDNIRYGRLDASEAEVKKAAKMAHAAEFIDKLPRGYETLVGERGVKLSGGQRQRIAIARAMVKNAPILVLDEATSALDSESEKYIQDALWKLMKGRTVLVIAHRLSTVQRMDRIIVLENGQITEQGTHKELLAKDGVYANLWNHQSGGFLEE